MIFDLVRDFSEVLDAIPANHLRRRILKLLDEALRRDVHFIDRHPTTLFQCLWNTCWWHDAPQAAAYFDLSKRTGTGPLPWDLPAEVRLATLLEHWRHVKEEATSGFNWVRSLRPPATHLGTAQKAVLRGHGCKVVGVALSAENYRIVSGSQDYTARVWDAASGQEQLCLRGHESSLTGVAISDDSLRIITASSDHTIRVWEGTTGQQLLCLRGHTNYVSSVALSSDGRRIVSVSHDETMRVWDAASGAQLLCLRWRGTGSECVAVRSDGRLIASGGDRLVRRWDGATGEELPSLRGHTDLVWRVALSRDGQRIVSGSWDKTVRVWDATTGQELLCLRGHEDRVKMVTISENGRCIVSGSNDNTIRVWDATSGQELLCLRGPYSAVNSLAVSSDGRRIVGGLDDGTVRIWDTTADAELLPLHGHDRGASSVAASRDGRFFVSGASDRTVRVWDAATGLEVMCLRGHERSVGCVDVSDDGRRVVSGSDDETVRVWDTTYGQELLCLRGHDNPLVSVAFSDGGRKIVSSSWDDTQRMWREWDAASGKCLRERRGGAEPRTRESQSFPFVVSAAPLETGFQNAATGHPVVWLVESLQMISPHPSGRVWTGSEGNHLYVVAMEGQAPSAVAPKAVRGTSPPKLDPALASYADELRQIVADTEADPQISGNPASCTAWKERVQSVLFRTIRMAGPFIDAVAEHSDASLTIAAGLGALEGMVDSLVQSQSSIPGDHHETICRFLTDAKRNGECSRQLAALERWRFRVRTYFVCNNLALGAFIDATSRSSGRTIENRLAAARAVLESIVSENAS